MKRKIVISVLISLTMIISAILSVAAVEVDTGTASDYTEPTSFEEEVNYPEIQSISPVSNGFKIVWNEFEGAAGYRVFCKEGTTWKRIGDTTETTFNHTGLKNNTVYTYTICALDKNKKEISAFNDTGRSNKFHSVPALSSVENVYGGLKLTWQKVSGAEKYRVYVKSGSTWTRIGDTTSNTLTYTSAVSGKAYTFTVRCLTADGKNFTGYFNTKGISGTYVAAPKISKIENIANGTTVTWDKVAGAAKYRLYYKTASTWVRIGTTTANTLNHTGLKNNTTYTYTVRALDKNDNFVSGFYSTGWSNKFLSVPALSSVESAYDGLKLTWQKVAGAEKYRAYVKNGSTWTKIGETTSNTFTYTSATSSKSYTFTVRCVSADGKRFASYFNTKGISGTYVAAPKISKMENIANGTTVTWDKVAGAAKYRLYYKSGSTWARVGTTTANTLNHTGLKNNTTYTYTVRALDKNDNFVSSFNSTGWSNKFLSVPTLSSVESVYGGLKLTWQKVAGAEKYRAYVKNGSTWTKICETTSNTFTYTSAVSGKSYTFTVRCVTADGKSFASYFNTKGISGTYVAAPKISKMENIANGTTVTWDKVAGAAKYRLYYKSGSTWARVGTTTANTLNHTGLKNNTVYTYTVRALDKNDNFVSSFYSTGWSNRYIAPPEYTFTTQSADGMLLTWNAVDTVASYRVYRKSYGGSWARLADVNGTSYTDPNPPKDIPYTYTLRCLNSSGSLISYFLTDTKYYYNGALANGKITTNGVSLYFVDGYFRQGYVTINGDTYYYSSTGVLQKNGIVGSKAEGFCYADKNGKIDYSFTGVAQNSAGYWYIIKGKLDFTYRNAVTYNGSDWNVIDGKATKVTTEEQRTLFRAFKLLSKITDNSMTKSQKLKKCWDYVKDAYIEKNPRIPHYTGIDWPVIYANDMFVRGVGNCMSYAACFAYLAKAIGYENVYCCNSGGHGWAEIDGLIYDPEWSRHHSKYSYYALSYDTKTDQNYKGAISAGYAWMHVKI